MHFSKVAPKLTVSTDDSLEAADITNYLKKMFVFLNAPLKNHL
jgi:hypothetical protein